MARNGGRAPTIQSSVARAAWPWAVAIAVVGLAAAVVLALGLLSRPAEESDPFSVARPRRGEARADHLADGTPVWVIGHEDGGVDVLSGFSTHEPFGLSKLLWWCPPSRVLDDPFHGSKWDEYGVRLDGPAPFGLSSWSLMTRGGRVFIGEPRPGPPMGTQPTGPSVQERQHCGADDGCCGAHLRRMADVGLAKRSGRGPAARLDPAPGALDAARTGRHGALLVRRL
jgi:hypothetical protein